MGFKGECQRKRWYRTRRTAREAARQHDGQMRAYRCPHCYGWHLTSDVSRQHSPTKPAKVNWRRERQRWLKKHPPR